MLILEVERAVAEKMQEALREQGEDYEVSEEERYFGDAENVTLILNNIGSALNIVSAVVSIYAAKSAIKASVNGNPVSFDKDTPEVTAKKIMTAAND